MKLRMLLLFIAVLILIGGALAWPHIRYRMISTDYSLPSGAARPLVVGHRGAGGVAPENTLAAFQAGMQSAELIELDVHLSKDGAVIVAHDADADRTTNGIGSWSDMTLEEIQKLDAGSWFDSRFAGQKIPTLSEVLAMVRGERTVLIELKWPNDGIYESLVAEVVRIIKEHQAESWTIVQSFERRYLRELEQTAPDIRRFQLVYGALNFPPLWKDRSFHVGYFRPETGVEGVGFYYPYLSEGLVKSLHTQRMKVGAYTVNDMDDVNRLMSLGADLIITDYPDRLRAHLKEWFQRSNFSE